MSILEIGCCGAYCKTCKEFRHDRCHGCKTGYADGKRDIEKARCKIKVCCIGKGFNSKNGYKYKKYEEATLFIKEKGYGKFLEIADCWKNQYGKYR